ncbi:MAG TPA: Crp/Fnr family transcriptional regulator [Ilumatobacteraceae bacterium]
MLASTTRRKYRKSEVIFHEDDIGDSLHLLERGRAAIRVSNSLGDEVIINVIGPGSFFGEQALVGDRNQRSATVVALQPVETLALRRADFDRLRAEHSTIDSVLVEALSERVNRLTDHLLEALFTPADKRVCRRLVELIGTYTVPGAVGPISIPLNQEELASLAGTSRPTANRVLQDLVQAEIILVRRGSVDVLDDARLKSRCT